MKALSLFSGVGGMDLAAEWAGIEIVAQAEVDKFCSTILKKHWPNVPNLGDVRTLFSEDSPARTFQLPEESPAFPESVPASGGGWFEPFAWYDPNSQSWRTWQGCLIEGWAKYSETWPKSGMTRNGIAYRRVSLERHIHGNGCSLLPTPLASDNQRRGHVGNQCIQRRMRLGKQIGLSMLFKNGPCPLCVEGMMGLPINWTA